MEAKAANARPPTLLQVRAKGARFPAKTYLGVAGPAHVPAKGAPSLEAGANNYFNLKSGPCVLMPSLLAATPAGRRDDGGGGSVKIMDSIYL